MEVVVVKVRWKRAAWQAGCAAAGPAAPTAASVHPGPWQNAGSTLEQVSLHLINLVEILFAVLNLVGGHPRSWLLEQAAAGKR